MLHPLVVASSVVFLVTTLASPPASSGGSLDPSTPRESRLGVDAFPSHVARADYEIAMAAPDSFRVGEAAFVELILEAKGAFKCNDQYPYRFRFEQTRGVALTHPVVGKGHVHVDAREARMKLPFVPNEPGRHRVEGTFSFSVCTADRCLVERQQLGVDIDVR